MLYANCNPQLFRDIRQTLQKKKKNSIKENNEQNLERWWYAPVDFLEVSAKIISQLRVLHQTIV